MPVFEGDSPSPSGNGSAAVQPELPETLVEMTQPTTTVLQDDQEKLSSALLALSCHFAQVQFRLQQIRKAPASERDVMLQELEEFSYRGCPDVLEAKQLLAARRPNEASGGHANDVSSKELEMINELRRQLDDLEAFAYERGAGDVPSSKVMEKQRVIIEHLQGMLPVNLSHIDKLTSEDLQRELDGALKQLVNPIKIKEQLVQQLQTQIVDLERFVEFLQGGNDFSSATASSSSLAKSGPRMLSNNSSNGGGGGSILGNFLSQLSTMLHVYFLSQLGCHGQQFRRNALKKTIKGAHWGDLRATLQTTVVDLTDLCQRSGIDVPALSASESDVVEWSPREVLRAVRRHLCPAIRDLLSHGLMDDAKRNRRKLLTRFCKQDVEDLEEAPVHVWNVVEKYYLLKHGRELAELPDSTLSSAFQLDRLGRSVTSRQVLLKTVDGILSSHLKLRRTNDAMFKAFVSAALNERKLMAWLRMIFRCQDLLDKCYASWGYVVVVGVDEMCQALERLGRFHFSLPVDFAVRPFNSISDAF